MRLRISLPGRAATAGLSSSRGRRSRSRGRVRSAGTRNWSSSIGPTRSIAKFAAPKLEVGDTWVSRLNETDGKIEVVKISGSRMFINWFGHQNTYTLDGNLVSGHIGTLIGSFDPDLGTFNFPLWAGKKWSKDWLLKTDQGRIWGNTHGQALNWEQVTRARRNDGRAQAKDRLPDRALQHADDLLVRA